MKNTIYSKSVFSLVFVALCSIPAWSQGLVNGGSGGLMLGYRQANMDGFQEFLPASAGDLSNGFFLLGIEGYSMFQRVIIGGKGYFLNSSRVSYDRLGSNFEAKPVGGMGFLNIGYAVVSQPKFLIFPMIGIGGGSITMINTLNEDVDFDDIVTNNTGALPLETNITNRSFLLDFEIGVDFFPIGTDDDLKLGLRAGYTLAVRRDRWWYSGGEIRNGPEGNISGFHVSFVLGGGKFE